ncbi:MAG: hypothetical protein ACRENU_02225 [Gemmatimonadaceae bacterium]
MRDLSLLLFGAILALGADQWRESRAGQRRTALAIAGIRAELTENLARVEGARVHHLMMADTLGAYAHRRELPPEGVYFGGVLRPAPVLSTAWQTARETGALSELPYSLLLHLAPVYETQDRYRAMGESLAQGVMLEAQRRGAIAVFREGFANFILVEQDFANREAVLARRYRQALASLDSVGVDATQR